MKNFPRIYAHPSGREMVLDEARLLLTFNAEVDKKEIENSLRETGLVIDSGDSNGDSRKPREAIVNNSDSRYFVKSIQGKTIDDATVEKLEKQFQKTLSWIGPVYKIPTVQATYDAVVPTPNVLLLKISPFARSVENVIKKIKSSFSLSEVESKSKHLNNIRYFEMKDSSKQNAYGLKDQIMKMSEGAVQNVSYENIPYYVPLCVTPNDTLFASQWDMTQIQAPAAWDINTGVNTVVVAVLDTGCDLTHPDLQFASTGVDLGDMVSDGSPNSFGTVTGHGTCCAGIVAAAFNNTEGISGVAGNCRVLPIAFSTFGDTEVAAGINFAVANGATAVSMSFGQYAVGEGSPSGWDFTIIDPAIQNAVSSGVVLCAATGNENRGDVNRYPAKNSLVIACGASSTDDNRKSTTSPDPETFWGANFGEENYNGILSGVSVVAPGVLIPSTDIQGAGGFNMTAGAAGNYFMTFNGTSSATPHVAGFAGLLKSQYPSLNNIQIRNVIEQTADKSGTLAYNAENGFANGPRNQEMGYGRINLFKGLDFANIMIKDWSGDDGSEPSNPPGGDFWDFSDIVVRIFDDNVFNPSNPSQSKNVERGQSNYIYVQLTNKGPRDARNVVVDCRITPFIGLQFRYPDDWTLLDSMHVQPTPVTNTFATVAAGSTIIGKFTISAAQTDTLYGWENSNPWHPCLLASVKADNDYAFATASFAEDPLSQLRNNLAQRNLSVIDVLATASASIIRFPFIAGHFMNKERFMEIFVENITKVPGVKMMLSLDDDGKAFPFVNFGEVNKNGVAEHNDKDLVFLERTNVETNFGGCRGILTLEKGSRFHGNERRKLSPEEIKGGEVIIKNGKRYVELRDQKASIKLAKEPGTIYPLSIAFELPANVEKGSVLNFRVSQRDMRGTTVGGAAAIYNFK
ncbi:MAG: S8 family serine peptidase [Chitinophagales bacterium]